MRFCVAVKGMALHCTRMDVTLGKIVIIIFGAAVPAAARCGFATGVDALIVLLDFPALSSLGQFEGKYHFELMLRVLL